MQTMLFPPQSGFPLLHEPLFSAKAEEETQNKE